MTTFNQQNQQVTYQYNAGGSINFGAVQNNYELAAEIDKIKSELTRAREGNAIDEDTETLAKSKLIEAAKEAKAPEPSKTTIVERLNGAKDALKGIVAVGSLYEAITKLIEFVHKMP